MPFVTPPWSETDLKTSGTLRIYYNTHILWKPKELEPDRYVSIGRYYWPILCERLWLQKDFRWPKMTKSPVKFTVSVQWCLSVRLLEWNNNRICWVLVAVSSVSLEERLTVCSQRHLQCCASVSWCFVWLHFCFTSWRCADVPGWFVSDMSDASALIENLQRKWCGNCFQDVDWRSRCSFPEKPQDGSTHSLITTRQMRLKTGCLKQQSN